MAVTVYNLGSSLVQVRDTDSDGTSEANVRAGATTIYAIYVDNSLNGAASYLKLYNATAPTIGTTAPDMIFMVPASTKVTISFALGIAFGTGLSYATVTAGGTAGTTNPTSDVIVEITCT